MAGAAGKQLLFLISAEAGDQWRTWTSETLRWHVSCHHQLSALGPSTRPTSSLSPCLPATASAPLRQLTPSEEVATPATEANYAQMLLPPSGDALTWLLWSVCRSLRHHLVVTASAGARMRLLHQLNLMLRSPSCLYHTAGFCDNRVASPPLEAQKQLHAKGWRLQTHRRSRTHAAARRGPATRRRGRCTT